MTRSTHPISFNPKPNNQSVLSAFETDPNRRLFERGGLTISLSTFTLDLRCDFVRGKA